MYYTKDTDILHLKHWYTKCKVYYTKDTDTLNVKCTILDTDTLNVKCIILKTLINRH